MFSHLLFWIGFLLFSRSDTADNWDMYTVQLDWRHRVLTFQLPLLLRQNCTTFSYLVPSWNILYLEISEVRFCWFSFSLLRTLGCVGQKKKFVFEGIWGSTRHERVSHMVTLCVRVSLTASLRAKIQSRDHLVCESLLVGCPPCVRESSSVSLDVQCWSQNQCHHLNRPHRSCTRPFLDPPSVWDPSVSSSFSSLSFLTPTPSCFLSP